MSFIVDSVIDQQGEHISLAQERIWESPRHYFRLKKLFQVLVFWQL